MTSGLIESGLSVSVKEILVYFPDGENHSNGTGYLVVKYMSTGHTLQIHPVVAKILSFLNTRRATLAGPIISNSISLLQRFRLLPLQVWKGTPQSWLISSWVIRNMMPCWRITRRLLLPLVIFLGHWMVTEPSSPLRHWRKWTLVITRCCWESCNVVGTLTNSRSTLVTGCSNRTETGFLIRSMILPKLSTVWLGKYSNNS